MSDPAECLNDATIGRLMLGQVPHDETERLARHLEQCGRCSALAERTAAADTLVEAIQSCATVADAPLSAEVRELIERMQTLPIPHSTAGGERSANESSGSGISPNILAPPQGPGEIGRLGRYRILKELGAGGMGRVFLAEHPVMERLVALKVISPRLTADPAAVARFQREVKAVARLQHPNIVTAFDADQAGGVHFLVMEFVEGTDLSQVLQQEGRVPPAIAAEYIRQAALGLEHAHQRGMVHRDLKPSNLMLTRDGTIKIMDLGLARFAHELVPTSLAEAQTALTGVQAILGTPDYMAPEQARDARSADIRADIYSLGATLYHLLSGQLPFPLSSAIDKIVAAQTTNPRPLLELVPDVPTALAEVMAKMMARKPAERYQTPAEVAAALAAVAALTDGVNPAQSRSGPQASTAGQRDEAKPIAASSVGQVSNLPMSAKQQAGWKPAPQFLDEFEDNPAVLPGSRAPVRQTPAWKRKPIRMVAGLLVAVIGVALAAFGVVKLVIHTPDGTLIIDINQRGAEVTVDGNEVAISGVGEPVKIKVEPGKHLLKVTKGDFNTETRDFEITRGEEKALTVTLLPKTQPASPVTDMKPERAKDLANQAGPAPGVSAKPARSGSADTLRRENIPQYELAVAGGGDPQKAPAELVAILGNSRLKHWEFVYCVAFSPNSQILASGGTDQSVKIWDAATGDERRTLLGHTGIVRAVAFSPNGRTLASAGDDRTVKFWDVEKGALLKELAGHAGGVNCLAFSPDGRTTASGSGGLNDKSVKLWDVATGKEGHTLADHASGVSSVAFSPDKRTLASGSWDDTVKIWDVASGELLRTVQAHSEGVLSLAFSGKGDVFVTAGQNGMLKLWDTATWQVIREMKARGGRWYSVAMSQDGQTVASTSYADANDTVQLWDANTGQPKRILAGHTQWPERVAISPDGKWVAAANWDSTVKIWDVATGEPRRKPADDMSCVYFVAVSPDGRTLASGSQDHNVRLWDIESQQVRHVLPGHTHGIMRLAFSKDGRQLASASWDSTVRLWDVSGGKLIETIPAHDGGVSFVAFGPDNQTLVTGSDDGWVKVWDVATREARRTLREYAGVDCLVGLSPDGRLLASPRDNDIRLFDLATGNERSLPRTHTGRVFSVAFSPDGRMFASVSHDGTIRVWDAAKEQVLWPFEHPNVGVVDVAFSPDGRLLAAPGSDGKVRLWDLRSGTLRQTVTLGPPGGMIWNVAFTPDGRHLVTANRNGTIYVLRLANQTAESQ